MSMGESFEMPEFSTDSSTSELSTNLESKTTVDCKPLIEGCKALFSFPDLYAETSCSSADSSAPVSPPGGLDPNQDSRPLSANTANTKCTLVDLGYENVAHFFKTHEGQCKVTDEVAPAKREKSQLTVTKKTLEVKTIKKRVRVKPKPNPSISLPGSGRKLWEFVLGLLCEPATNPTVARWTDVQNGVFLFTNSGRAASLWGQRRGHPDLTYEHMSRAIRHYYRAGVILRVSGKRLMYKFGPKTPHWRQRVKTASTGSLLDALPKDFCDDASTQDNVPQQTELIAGNPSAVTMQSPEVAVISGCAAVKMELGAASPAKVPPLEGLTAVAELIQTCDENNNNTTNLMDDNRGDVYTDRSLTSLRFYHPALIQAGQEPAKRVPAGNCALPLPSFHDLDSFTSIHSDLTHSQHSCHIADISGFQQSPPESICPVGTDEKTVDMEVTLLNELETQTGLYVAGYAGVDSSGPVKMADIINDIAPSHVCSSNNLFCQIYQQRQQQSEQGSLPMDNCNTLLESTVSQCVSNQLSGDTFDRLSPDVQSELLTPMAEVQKHISASLLMLTA